MIAVAVGCEPARPWLQFTTPCASMVRETETTRVAPQLTAEVVPSLDYRGGIQHRVGSNYLHHHPTNVLSTAATMDEEGERRPHIHVQAPVRALYLQTNGHAS